MHRMRFNIKTLKKRTEIHYCIICGRYCTHQHHLVRPRNNGNHSDKNLVSICESCHKKLDKGLVKIKASKLSLETINYIKDKEIDNNAIDWKN